MFLTIKKVKQPNPITTPDYQKSQTAKSNYDAFYAIITKSSVRSLQILNFKNGLAEKESKKLDT